jgi:asparagine synthase (glutamine-hydrolysing)
MCGILGITSHNNNLQSKAFADQMLTHLNHRGPDANGMYHDENIILGHTRLSILDLSDAANQPMHSHNGRYVMVYNGEVYNFGEIQEELKKLIPGFAPRTTSDSEIILEAFSTWNVKFVEKLNGMFAIAIWDRHEKTLYLFRDRIGIKPIYYFYKNGMFAFASELKALVSNSEIKKELSLNYTAINKYLNLGYIPHPDSIYQEIKKFPAAHYAVSGKDGFQLYRYWNPEEFAALPRITSIEEAVSKLRSLVESSVKYRLISDVPYGTFLSGGIDSSLVTAVAQKMNHEPVNTFSIGFWEKEFNEAPFARRIAEHLGTVHHEFTVTEKEAIEWIPQLLSIYDEPYADSSAIPTLLVSRMARQTVTMTLSGDGGDELFMGYGAYKWAERLSNPYISALKAPIRRVLNCGNNRFKRVSHLFEKISPDHFHSHIFSQEQYLFSRKEIKNYLNAPFHEEFELDEKYNPRLTNLTPAERQALFDIKYYLPDDLLVKVDRASMHFALETRVPLLDYRIAELALQLDPKLKIRNGSAKWLLKELLYEYVPREFFNRPKWGFAIPLRNWLKTELKEFVMDHLNYESVKKYGVLNVQQTEALLNEFYKKDRNYLYNRIWQLVLLQKWIGEKFQV